MPLDTRVAAEVIAPPHSDWFRCKIGDRWSVGCLALGAAATARRNGFLPSDSVSLCRDVLRWHASLNLGGL